MTESLVGRTAVVTGGGNGLGRAMCRSLSVAGARVIAVGRKKSTVEETLAGLQGPGRAAVCDVADPDSVRALVEELVGEDVSILVNNAGVAGPVKPLIDVEPGEWDGVFDINVRGVYQMCRAFLPAMIERGSGDVVNLASVSGKRPLLNRTPYTASKMAVIGLTTTLAGEVGPAGVAVNSLSPGPVAGPRMQRNFRLEAERTGTTEAEAEREFVSRSLMKRMVTEEEVGDALVRMLGMSGLCGADIDLSAGMVAR
ncbi:SDR family oxidoreductase [Saccharopolyspora halophila]|uniref:SDR family oxidoreductase n=1 Tax=Saccharopolyspora halophila TaxID=405551 RepID=A0ABP5TRP7_9PSEU